MSWFWRALAWGSIHNSVDNENVVKSYMMGFFKPKEGSEAKGYKTFGNRPKLFDIVYAETSKMVDFIIEVKQDGLDDNGLVKWTFSIVFIDGEGDVDIPFLCILPVSKKSFEETMVELHEYKSEHGDCKVPQNFKSNPSL